MRTNVKLAGVLACLSSACASTQAAPQLAAPPIAVVHERPPSRALEWKPEWSRANAADYAVTSVGLATTLAMAIVPPRSQHVQGGVLFDDAARSTLRLSSLSDRYVARDMSDVLLSLVTSYPILFDSFIIGYGYFRNADVAYQMAVIDAEALAIASSLQGIANVTVSRERPYGQDCGTAVPATTSDCNGPSRYRSFFSGHATISFTSAGLACSHHLKLRLFGDAADILACATALATASAVSLLRVMGDEHYATDVFTGALVGAAVGFIVPAFHYATHSRKNARTSLEWHVAPSAGGLGIAGTF
jgi:membrane-associated phospholipid phosphatase